MRQCMFVPSWTGTCLSHHALSTCHESTHLWVSWPKSTLLKITPKMVLEQQSALLFLLIAFHTSLATKSPQCWMKMQTQSLWKHMFANTMYLQRVKVMRYAPLKKSVLVAPRRANTSWLWPSMVAKNEATKKGNDIYVYGMTIYNCVVNF